MPPIGKATPRPCSLSFSGREQLRSCSWRLHRSDSKISFPRHAACPCTETRPSHRSLLRNATCLSPFAATVTGQGCGRALDHRIALQWQSRPAASTSTDLSPRSRNHDCIRRTIHTHHCRQWGRRWRRWDSIIGDPVAVLPNGDNKSAERATRWVDRTDPRKSLVILIVPATAISSASSKLWPLSLRMVSHDSRFEPLTLPAPARH